MYRIKCDDFTLYNPGSSELVLGNPSLNLEVNKAGSLSFSIYPTHPYFNVIDKMKSIVTVLQDERVIFRGRVFSDTVNFYKVKKVESEGVLTYFNDSIVRPYDFTGTVLDYFTFLITQHNDQVAEAQRFKIGNVTVTDNNDYIVRANANLPKTWTEIDEKLIKILGGYISVRYEDDGNYIDYLADFTDNSTQEIKFAVNLLELENVVKSDTLATCIIPYGAKLSDIKGEEDTGDTGDTGDPENGSEGEIEEITTPSEERLTIESVNDGVDYIQNDEAVAMYGKIYEVVTWDDVTDPNNLLTKAREYLSGSIQLSNTLTIKAIDLHLTDKTIESFKLGDYIRVYSKPHGIDKRLLLTAYNIDISNPSGFTFTLGDESTSFVDSQISTDRVASDNVGRIDKVNRELGTLNESLSKNVSETLTYINEVIENSKEYTRTLVSEYAKTSDLEELNEAISTTFKHTAESIDVVFKNLSERITEENGEITKELEEITKYIRFDNATGSIILGEVGNILTTKISNGRISFLYNDSLEVAYISDQKLYITKAEILESIIIGTYQFVPRDDGLAFEVIGG